MKDNDKILFKLTAGGLFPFTSVFLNALFLVFVNDLPSALQVTKADIYMFMIPQLVIPSITKKPLWLSVMVSSRTWIDYRHGQIITKWFFTGRKLWNMLHSFLKKGESVNSFKKSIIDSYASVVFNWASELVNSFSVSYLIVNQLIFLFLHLCTRLSCTLSKFCNS